MQQNDIKVNPKDNKKHSETKKEVEESKQQDDDFDMNELDESRLVKNEYTGEWMHDMPHGENGESTEYDEAQNVVSTYKGPWQYGKKHGVDSQRGLLMNYKQGRLVKTVEGKWFNDSLTSMTTSDTFKINMKVPVLL